MSDCQAGPKQWAALKEFVKDNYDEGYAACILELRARVEALEANSKPTPNPSQIRSSPVGQEPTDKELCETYRAAYYACEDRQGPAAQAFALRAVLASWGNQ